MIKTIATFFLNPFNIFLLLLAGSLILWQLDKRRAFTWLISGAVVWLLLISTALLPQSFLISLEYRHLPLTETEASDFGPGTHIIVLGGGHGFNENLPANSLLSTQALARLNEGVRLHRLIPGSTLVFSGYSETGRTTQAEMLQAAAFNIGIKPENTTLQRNPVNTYEEAKVYSETYKNSYDVILVTSAAHIPRAAMLFETCGVDFTVSPANYRIWDPERPKRLWPSASYIEQMRIALYEYAGIFRDGFREC